MEQQLLTKDTLMDLTHFREKEHNAVVQCHCGKKLDNGNEAKQQAIEQLETSIRYILRFCVFA